MIHVRPPYSHSLSLQLSYYMGAVKDSVTSAVGALGMQFFFEEKSVALSIGVLSILVY